MRNRSPSWLAQAKNAAHAFRHESVDPLLHNFINLGASTVLLGAAVAPIFALGHLPPLVLVLLGVPYYGYLYFCLFILVVHEASHGMFVTAARRSTARRLNRFFGAVACVPFGVDYLRYWERGHMIHHRLPCDRDVDPQNCEPLVGWRLHARCLRMAFIPGYVQVMSSKSGAGTAFDCPAAAKLGIRPWIKALTCVFWGAIIVISIALHAWPVAIAMLLGMQITAVLQQYKVAMEHGGAIASLPDVHLRSRTSLFVGRRLLMPFNISLHFEHHLAPSVPWYLLFRYHRRVRGLLPSAVSEVVMSRRVWATIGG